MEPATTRIAHVLEPEADIDLSADSATPMESRHSVDAHLKILKTGDQMRQSVLELLPDLRWG